MSDTPLYLKQTVFMEPLINQWYAWGNLVPAQTFAMVVTNLHLKIMQSYLQSPQMHQNAVKNPKMLGGPFIDLPGNSSGIVKELLDKTTRDEDDLIRFAGAVKQLDELLGAEAKGHSMFSLYERIPAELRGYVELGYDLNNQPSIRFLERMLYKSPFYRESRQSIRVSVAGGDDRAFALSTPRFADETHLHYNLPFRSEAIDRLFRMKFEPAALASIEDLMPETPEQQAFFRSLFTTEAPQQRADDRASLGDQVRVRYYGHAVLLFESADVSIMTDPVVSYKIEDTKVPRFTYEDLPARIDYVVITHNHQDHILWETLLPLRHRIGTIIVPRCNGGSLQDPSLKLIMEAVGFQNVIELDEMESLPVPGGAITGVPFFGEHGDLHIRSKLAYHIRLKDKVAMCAADSNNLAPEIYEFVAKSLGPVKTVFVGMECEGAPMSWLYGPLLTKPLERRMDQSRRLDGSESTRALHMLETLGAESAYIYAMGQEPWLKFISSISYTEASLPIVESNKVVKAYTERGKIAERLFGKKEFFL